MQWHYSPAPGAAMPAWSFGLQYGMVFALGATLACWRHLWIERRPLAMTAMLLLLAVLYFKGPAIIAGQAPLLALAVFSVVAGSASTPLLKHAGHFGDFSYGLYIYAFPVQQLVVWHFADRLGYGAALACTVAGTGLLAVLSWHLLEKQALTFKPARPASGAPKIPSSHVTG
jgi:peptidoglycan/LPS O-acetylase OafA/YrhL